MTPAGTSTAPPMSRVRLTAGTPAGEPVGTGGPWRLFNLKEDPAELHDVSDQHADIYAQLRADWARYAATNGVLVKSGKESIER